MHVANISFYLIHVKSLGGNFLSYMILFVILSRLEQVEFLL
jgi:hypothetical protein